ncbi:MAG TPA: TIGR03032 family protein [Solimonas sp.]|nr:TIGR03032 family protein [Solimonas sp.]
MTAVPPEQTPGAASPGEAAAIDLLASEHSTNLPAIFEQLGLSLLVTTYQAGKLVAVRRDGERLNTHFRHFAKPMGLAADATRFTLGTSREIVEYHNLPAVAAQIEPRGHHDACYIPRSVHVTGDIDIHEMGYGQNGELWLINTRFSCLCTLDGRSSFVPRWRPDFVGGLAAEDRCHLNGLGMVNGMPRFVTALGVSDQAAGWRPEKAHGGVLMDLSSNRIVCQGLSMPHSPRWYMDQLWVLESGRGSLARVDPASGKWTTVIELPGFTRGLDFFGPLAFIGLSQIRESATFGGLPLTERLTERNCGVWVVNIITGALVGFLRFKSGVQEIFAVNVLPGTRYPDILEPDDPLVASSYALPEQALRDLAPATPGGR